MLAPNSYKQCELQGGNVWKKIHQAYYLYLKRPTVWGIGYRHCGMDLIEHTLSFALGICNTSRLGFQCWRGINDSHRDNSSQKASKPKTSMLLTTAVLSTIMAITTEGSSTPRLELHIVIWKKCEGPSKKVRPQMLVLQLMKMARLIGHAGWQTKS